MSRPPKPSSERDPDLINAEIALHRAAQRARDKARAQGVAVVYVQDGKIIKEYPGAPQPSQK
jgi:LDH2 family malate/lactate/ureidoglycolate dehydrogenase